MAEKLPERFVFFPAEKGSVLIPLSPSFHTWDEVSPGKPYFLLASYDLKNNFENLPQAGPSAIRFPEISIYEAGEKITFLPSSSSQPAFESAGKISCMSQKDYLERAGKLLEHIKRGDIYEVNFCLHFEVKGKMENPFSLFSLLYEKNKSPYSFLFRDGNRWIFSTSPERFIKKVGTVIFSQPMKGTIARSDNPEEDMRLKESLRNSLKDQTENVMIVDIVRNDLSAICKRNSVKVDELFGIQSFGTVHQMVSTVSGDLKEGIGIEKIFRHTFTMASMTGAPKIRAMELIHQYETHARSAFSGCSGFIAENGDFDFSVNIRSLFYDETTGVATFSAGSALTAASNPEEEYAECLLKARPIMEVLGVTLPDA
jgi:para-aminobenzoate synthetase component I